MRETGCKRGGGGNEGKKYKERGRENQKRWEKRFIELSLSLLL